MKATVALREQRKKQLLSQMQATPMRPLPLYYRNGWDHFVHEEVSRPQLGELPDPDTDVAADDPRISYHKHMRMITTDAMDHILQEAVDAVDLNCGRREGVLDRVIDGPRGTGKTALLRAVGRAAQLAIEEAQGGPSGKVIPLVHITSPADSDSKVNWVWEIASFLGLNPAPKNETELLEWRRYPDLSVPVNYVLENAQTRLLLVDNIDRVTPDQLAAVLPYFDFLRSKLGITTIFCGTGASARIEQARHRTETDIRLTAGNHTAEQQPTQPASLSPPLPVTWLHPFPLDTDDQETFYKVLASFEKNLVLHRLEEHALTRYAKELHQRTDGYLTLLSQLICSAALHAIRSKSENITLTELNAANIGGR